MADHTVMPSIERESSFDKKVKNCRLNERGTIISEECNDEVKCHQE